MSSATREAAEELRRIERELAGLQDEILDLKNEDEREFLARVAASEGSSEPFLDTSSSERRRAERIGYLEGYEDALKRNLLRWQAHQRELDQPQQQTVRPHSPAGTVGPLEWFAQKVPPRIANEEIGDAMEVIHKMVNDQRSAWSIYLKVARAVFWVSVHTVQHHAWKFLGIVKLAMGQGDDRR